MYFLLLKSQNVKKVLQGKLPQFILSSVVVAQEQEEKVSKNSLYKQTDDEPDVGEADQENWKEPSLEWFY